MALSPRPNAGKLWTPEETGTLRRLAEARVSPREVAGQLGRSIEAVTKHAAKIGVKLGQSHVERAVQRRGALRSD